MNSNQLTSVLIALINSRLITPGKDNEKTVKEVIKIYRTLKKKLGDENSEDDDDELEMMMPPASGYQE
jgi:hypothetical protein